MDARGELLQLHRSPLIEVVVMGEGVVMNPIGVLVVAELCEAIADFVDAAPKLAAQTARKMGATLRGMLEKRQADGFKLDEIRAKRGKSTFGD